MKWRADHCIPFQPSRIGATARDPGNCLVLAARREPLGTAVVVAFRGGGPDRHGARTFTPDDLWTRELNLPKAHAAVLVRSCLPSLKNST